MDKKNTLLGALLVIAAIACYFIGAKNSQQRPTPEAVRQAVARQQAAAPAEPQTLSAGGAPAEFASISGEHAGAVVTTLENDFIKVRFTNFGGGIRDVALKKYPAALNAPDPFILNRLHYNPMLAFVDFPGLDRSTRFDLVSKSATEVVFRTILDGRIEVTRRYVLSPNEVGSTDPYRLHLETTFRNLTGGDVAPLRVSLELGTAAPLNALDRGQYLTTGYSDGSSQKFTSRSQLEESGGIFGYNAHGPIPEIVSEAPIQWATVTNQFFACILTPSAPAPAPTSAADKPAPKIPAATATGMVTRRVKLLDKLPDSDRSAYGVTAATQFDVPALAAHGIAKLDGDFYVGPKEYRRLANIDVFKEHEDKVMQFGFFKVFSELLLTLMTWIHSFVPNWGLAIIFTTLALKTVFLPLTLIASRSARRMQKLQPELKVLREKFKDNPQKQQAATMALFKERKVNPMGGCLPMLIPMPFFFGFYRMLYSAAELRFAPFLWAHDLSAPDTVGHLLGYNINILPILFTIVSLVQVQLTPQPTVDSSQAKMMKFMPLFVLFIYYGFSCALSLYSTTNGLFSIIQQLAINRTKDPVLAAIPAAKFDHGKPMKNVTPKKKK